MPKQLFGFDLPLCVVLAARRQIRHAMKHFNHSSANPE
jgi:hypothetical protein